MPMKRSAAFVLTAGLSLGAVAAAQGATPTAQTQTSAVMKVSDVQFEGFTVFDAAQLAQAMGAQLGIKSGGQVTAEALEEGRTRLAQTYAEAGYPFTPQVKLTTTPGTATSGTVGVAVKYSVDESAPLSQVAVSGVSLLPASQLQTIFKPLTNAKRLSAAGYEQALTGLAQAYAEAGYVFRPEDVKASLAGGVMTVQVTEPIVTSIKTSGLKFGTPPSYQTRKGTGLMIAALNADAHMLSNLTGLPVVWQADSAEPGQVSVMFQPLAGARAEKIQQIVIQGNSHVSTADIQKVMLLKTGDISTPQLAQQDFYAIQKLYDDRGYALAATDDSLSFEDGVLTYNLHEAKIAGYVLNWPNGKPLLNEQVALHTLPAVGSVIQHQQMRRALSALAAYDRVELQSQQTRADDPAHSENLTFILNFAEEKRSVPLSAALSYSGQQGIGGEGSFGTNNLLGTGQGLNLTLGANGNDVGQYLSGSVNYSIPWINSNFLDFARRPTSLNLSVWSSASGNNPLYVKGADGLPTSTDTGRQYTVRSSGVSASLGRNLNPNVSASVGLTVANNRYLLEPYKSSDTTSATSADLATYQDDAQASAQVPLGSTTAFPNVGLGYDTTDSVIAPNFGVRAHTNLGYGFGQQSDGSRLSWGQVEAGGSTYYGFGRTLDDGSRQEVIAGRVNAGTILGRGGESNVFRLGGSNPNSAYELRGFDNTISGTSYVSGSAELRHNFGVKLGNYVTGLYGLAFVDAGDAWTPSNTSNPFGVNVAYGVGAQINTSLLNFQVNYGRTISGNGKFTFKIGNFW